MFDIFIVLVLFGIVIFCLALIGKSKPSRRDELAAQIYAINRPCMTWKEAYDEADFWMDYTGQQ
jgi:hypothetical protein